MDLDLDGWSVFITAASKGLGLAVATRMVDEGASVVITSRSEENLKAAEERVLDETGADPDAIDWVVCDLKDERSIRSATQTAVDRPGTLDALITNHVAPPSSTFAEASIDEFDAAYESVLRCTLLLCQEVLPALRDGGGSITHLVAVSSLEPTSNGALGHVFRPGIYGLSKVQANELGEEGIRVNCVAPHGVVTDRIRTKVEQLTDREGIAESEAWDRREAELPVDELGSTEEFARAAAFVASPAASYVTGSVIPVEGGWHSRIA
ncbi:SDR family oxidoreductase [Natrialba asiatica]|uniref:Short-chain dehydrogenase/reductase SDR n=1 Tax=Natrialba asiatica (strain ATCC 700177 / DSM 12278 / JCM 9576 / FERM P-10747 / NBRC 102637 / 172P1) TaxID=29540 RepID=M0AEY0_NATA1|nr:SDR family oxidoreductase [Natrialba asiatica]ELY97074.1 short-chain dehydrogenase/reductase SDR [Natrialba asiatica DSM 12278]